VRQLRRHGGVVGLAGALLFSLILGALAGTAPGAATSYRDTVLADAPAGYWRLGETSGLIAADASPNALHGSYKGGVTLGVAGAIAGDTDGAARFDGSNDRVVVNDPASGALDFGTGDFSAEAWIATTGTGDQSIVGKRSSGPYWYMVVTDDAGHVGQLRATLNDGAGSRSVYSTVRIDDGGWHHVAARFDRNSGIFLYVDGAASGSWLGAKAGSVSNSSALQIGKVSGGIYFNGDIDEVAVYPGLLPLASIQARYAAGGDTTAPLVTLAAPADGSSTTDATPTFSGTGGTATGDSSTVTVKLYEGSGTGGALLQTRTTTRASTNGAFAVDASPALAPGTYTARAEQSDGAGNTGLSAPSTFTVLEGPPPPPAGDPILMGAGDIASCGETARDAETGQLLDAVPTATVFTAGDNAYTLGTAEEFANCYDPVWGLAKARTRPAPGNHDYGTPGAAGYFGYFGANAGDPTKGYYSYDLGAWHIISLNSNCYDAGGCDAGSPQEQWLRADLAAHPASCTLAYWHHPRFNSGSVHGMSFSEDVKPFWEALYEYGAEVVVSGHEHLYERFLPQTVMGVHDPDFGITHFTAGMGGYSHYSFGTIQPNSAARNATDFGVLKFVLHDGWYEHEFVGIPGVTYTDAGSANCHGKPGDEPPPPDTTPPVVSLAAPAQGSSTTNPLPAFTGTAGVAVGDSSTVTVKLFAGTGTGGTPSQTLTATRAGDGSYSVAAASPLAPGDYTAQAEQTDAAGNLGLSSANTFTVLPPPPDTTPPAISLAAPAHGSSTTDATPALSGTAGTASGDSTTVTVKVFAGSGTGGTLLQTLTTTRAGNGAYSVDASTLAPGTYTAHSEQTDAAGNTGVSNANTFTIVEGPPPPAYLAAVASDGPRSHWRLGEASGTTAADATGANAGSYLNGVTLGAPGAIAGDVDTAARFDGTNDQVTMGDPATGSLDFGPDDFTVEAWVKTTLNGERAIVSKRASSSPPYWQLTVTDDSGHVGEIRANFNSGLVDRQVYGPARRVDDGAWHHVVAAFDRDAGITIYVDGLSRFNAGVITADVSNTGPFLVGKSAGYGYFSGDIDEVAVYPSLLSAARVQAHYDAGRGVG